MQVRAGPRVCDHAVFVEDRKKFVGAMSVVCTTCTVYILKPYFFSRGCKI